VPQLGDRLEHRLTRLPAHLRRTVDDSGHGAPADPGPCRHFLQGGARRTRTLHTHRPLIVDAFPVTFPVIRLRTPGQATSPNHLRVPFRAVLGYPALCRIVDIDETEPFGVTPRPFEIIHQRPREVAFQWNSVPNGRVTGPQVGVQIGDALTVVHGV